MTDTRYETKAAFEDYIRDALRASIGDDADTLTELDYVSDLAEDGWPDSEKWLTIWCRLNEGGELTPREREQAVVYHQTLDGDDVPEQFRLGARHD